MTKKVNFIGIGVQKAGTTWIHRILDEHPQVCVAHGNDKDTRFFGAFYDRGYEWYENHFDNCEDNDIVGEVSTSYFYDTNAPSRIKSYNNDIKLFVCLRNPVERVISNHKHEARAGHITGDNLDLATALKNNPAYLMQSHYATHLKQWYKCFDKEQLHIMLFDDLVARPLELAKDLYSFLGVDDNFVPELTQKDNVSRVPASIRAERGIKVVGNILRSSGLGRVVKAGRQYGFNQWIRSRNVANDDAGTLSISDETVDELNKLLKPEILELAEITGLDLSRWIAK